MVSRPWLLGASWLGKPSPPSGTESASMDNLPNHLGLKRCPSVINVHNTEQAI